MVFRSIVPKSVFGNRVCLAKGGRARGGASCDTSIVSCCMCLLGAEGKGLYGHGGVGVTVCIILGNHQFCVCERIGVL